MRKSVIAREIAVAVAAGAVSATAPTLEGEEVRLQPFIALLTPGEEPSAPASAGFGVGVLLLDEVDRTVWVTLTYHNLSGIPSRASIDRPTSGRGEPEVAEFASPMHREGEIAGTSRAFTPEEVAALKRGQLQLGVRTSAAASWEIRGRILPAPMPYRLGRIITKLRMPEEVASAAVG